MKNGLLNPLPLSWAKYLLKSLLFLPFSLFNFQPTRLSPRPKLAQEFSSAAPLTLSGRPSSWVPPAPAPARPRLLLGRRLIFLRNQASPPRCSHSASLPQRPHPSAPSLSSVSHLMFVFGDRRISNGKARRACEARKDSPSAICGVLQRIHVLFFYIFFIFFMFYSFNLYIFHEIYICYP